jgi:hypothetical protein
MTNTNRIGAHHARSHEATGLRRFVAVLALVVTAGGGYLVAEHDTNFSAGAHSVAAGATTTAVTTLSGEGPNP